MRNGPLLLGVGEPAQALHLPLPLQHSGQNPVAAPSAFPPQQSPLLLVSQSPSLFTPAFPRKLPAPLPQPPHLAQLSPSTDLSASRTLAPSPLPPPSNLLSPWLPSPSRAQSSARGLAPAPSLPTSLEPPLLLLPRSPDPLVSPLQTLQSTTAPSPSGPALPSAPGANTDPGAPSEPLSSPLGPPPALPIPSPQRPTLQPPPFAPVQDRCPFHRRLRPSGPTAASSPRCHPVGPLGRRPRPLTQASPPLRSDRSPPPIGSRPPPVSAAAPPPVPASRGAGSWRVGIGAPGPPRLRRVTEPGLAVSAASRLSGSPPRPRPPRRGAAPRKMLASQAGCSRRRIPATPTDGSSPAGPAPLARALGRSALTDEHCSQWEGADAVGPGSPGPSLPPPHWTPASRSLGVRALRASQAPLPGRHGPRQVDPQLNFSVFREPRRPGPLPIGSSPCVPHPTPSLAPGSVCRQRLGLANPKERLGPPIWGIEGARPMRGLVRSALCWLRPGAGPDCGSPGKETWL